MPRRARLWRKAGQEGEASISKERVFFQHDSRPQQEEFHRQMLQKLALHLAAQPDTPTPSPHASQYVAPMSMSPAAAEAHAVPAPAPEVRKAPSPSFSQGHQSHPALQPECNQELLRKLALHLAAQDHPLDKPHLEVQGDGIKWQPMNDPAAIGEDLCAESQKSAARGRYLGDLSAGRTGQSQLRQAHRRAGGKRQAAQNAETEPTH